MYIANIARTPNMMLRPNGIDAPYEIVDGYDENVFSFHDTFEEGLSYGLELARRSAFLLGARRDPFAPVEYFDFRRT